jgi:raffinose/stachyose/melibiose transport system permease protein
MAIILWGFPWVGSVGVLIYVACLDSIGKEIYEAAAVDGANWFHQFRFIELPLILRQIRVMMVLVIMGSINDAGTVMVMCGTSGGPGGVADVPALFMFQAQRLACQTCGLAGDRNGRRTSLSRKSNR